MLELGDRLGAPGIGGLVGDRRPLDVEVDVISVIGGDGLAVGSGQCADGLADGRELGAGLAPEGDDDVATGLLERLDLVKLVGALAERGVLA